MKHLARCGAVACLLIWPVAASAQSANSNGNTDLQHSIDPQGATGQDGITNSGGPGAGEGKRRANTMPSGVPMPADKPPLQLSEEERAATRDAISLEHSHQRTPDKFEPRVGATVTSAVKPMPLPRPLVYEVPVLQQYAYAKLDRDVVLIDLMSMTVVDVIPRKFPANEVKPLTPVEWAATRGRELLGLPPLAEEAASTTGAAAGGQASAAGPAEK